jgi:hypothetical protein
MNNNQISRLYAIAVIAASLLAVGVVAAISMVEEADALIRQRNSVTITQSSGSNSVTVTQSNSATQSNGVTQSASQSNSVTATQTN